MDLLRSAWIQLTGYMSLKATVFIKGVIKKFQISMNMELAQMLQTTDNKDETAEIRRQQKVHLLNTSSGDVCCGFILLASFYHVQGYHYTALEILNTSLQKVTPAILQARKANYSQEEKERYMNMCGRGFTLEQKMKSSIVSNIVVLDNSSVVPREFKPEVDNCRPLYVIPPIAYAHAIKFLCYHYLNDVKNKKETLQKFEEIVMRKYFVLERYFSNALTLLGPAMKQTETLKTQGDAI